MTLSLSAARCSVPHRTRRQLARTTAVLAWLVLAAGCSTASHLSPEPGAPTPSAPGTRPTPVLESKPTSRPVSGPDRRPNIVLITTDDQTTADMRWMPRTRRLLGEAGVTFANALSPHPLCCPARAEILTGQYAQNNGVRHNKGPYGGFKALDGSRTIATWLNAARYQTAFLGKYLNAYEARGTMEPGWDIWNPLSARVYNYYDYKMLNHGAPHQYLGTHSSDLLSRKNVEYIEQFSRRPQPFFIWVSHVAPHSACLPRRGPRCWVPPLPTARHESLFPDAQPPSLRDPAFNEADVSDKPPAVRAQRARDAETVSDQFRRRIRSLQAVDEGVATTIRALRRTGELRNTIVVFTSDNGFMLGEHRLVGKNVPYEQALSVPLYIRGPGIPPGKTRDQVVTTIDLAPTFLDAARAGANLPVDGRNILPLAKDPGRAGYDTVLIQSGPRNRAEEASGWYYRGVRTDRYTYVRYPAIGFTELYDRKADPHQLRNIAGNPAYREIEQELDRRTTVLGRCSGADCRTRFPALPDRGPPRSN